MPWNQPQKTLFSEFQSWLGNERILMSKLPGGTRTAKSWGSKTCKCPEDPNKSFAKPAEEADIVLLNRVFNKLMQQMWVFG